MSLLATTNAPQKIKQEEKRQNVQFAIVGLFTNTPKSAWCADGRSPVLNPGPELDKMVEGGRAMIDEIRKRLEARTRKYHDIMEKRENFNAHAPTDIAYLLERVEKLEAVRIISQNLLLILDKPEGERPDKYTFLAIVEATKEALQEALAVCEAAGEGK